VRGYITCKLSHSFRSARPPVQTCSALLTFGLLNRDDPELGLNLYSWNHPPPWNQFPWFQGPFGFQDLEKPNGVFVLEQIGSFCWFLRSEPTYTQLIEFLSGLGTKRAEGIDQVPSSESKKEVPMEKAKRRIRGTTPLGTARWFRAERRSQEYAVWLFGIARNRNRLSEPSPRGTTLRFQGGWFHEYAVLWLNTVDPGRTCGGRQRRRL
jgi:hypothetical protein